MPRAKGLLEAYNMSRKDLVKLYNRIVERVNKQITRLKKSKVNYKDVIEPKDLRRLKLLREKTWKKLSTKELFRRYTKLVTEKPDYRQKAVKEAIKQKKALQAILGGRKISAKQYNAMEKLVKRATSEQAMYYQLLRRMDSRGLIHDYRVPEEWKNKSTDEIMDDMLDQLNADMNKKNKQRRTKKEISAAELSMEDIKKDAWKWEATTGQKRRGETAWYHLTDDEIKEIEELFMP